MKKYWLFLFLFLVIFSACRREFGPPKWNVDALAPLINTKLTLQQLVKDSIITTNGANQLEVAYKQKFFTLNLDDLFVLPDTSNANTFQLPVGPLNFAPGQNLSSDSANTLYRIEGLELNEVVLESGKLAVKITSTIGETLDLNYALPTAFLNGNPFGLFMQIPSGSNAAPAQITDTFSLKGYTIDLRGRDKNKFNTLYTTSRLSVDANGNIVTINQGEYVIVTTYIIDAKPKLAKGYFKNQEIVVDPDVAAIDVFSIFNQGEMKLEEAYIDFIVSNEIGMDMRAKKFEVSSINTQKNSTVVLETNQLQNINLTRAYHQPTQNPPFRAVGLVKKINSSNSNVTEFLSNFPDQIGYSAQIEVNPLGNISGGNDFIYRGSGIDLSVDMVIPLSFNAKNLVLQDTAEYTLTQDAFYDNINGGFFKLVSTNTYPFSVTPQIYILSEMGSILDSLIVEKKEIPAAEIPTTGMEIFVTSEILIPINQSKLNLLYENKLMLIKATLNTPENTYARLYGNDYINMILVADINLKMQDY